MTEQFHDRHLDLFDPTVLEQKRVTLIGAGSVGSLIAWLLIRSGVRYLSVADMDTVSAANICRTIYRQKDIGRPKVEALKEILGEIRPEAQVFGHHMDLRHRSDEELAEGMLMADLVIATTDHPATQGRIAVLTYSSVPAIFVGVYARGTGGEVLFTLPNQTPCYHCILGQVRGEDGPDRGQTDYGVATGQLASEPALGVDIAHVTSCAAKIALGLLLRGTEAAAAKVIDPSRNIIFVGNNVDWIWRQPFESVWGRAERLDSCICRLQPGSSTASLIDLTAVD